MKTTILLAALIVLPLLLVLSVHKTARIGPSDFRDAPASSAAAEQLSGAVRAGSAAPAAVPSPVLSPASAAEDGNTAGKISARCSPPAAGEGWLSEADFSWEYYTMPEMMRRFDEAYVMPKRLPYRAYWDSAAKAVRLPNLEQQGGAVAAPAAFIRAVTRHIEKALELKYADAVFFPDMGHAYFLIPDSSWKTKYERYPVARTSALYAELLRDPAVKFLYHTAEQLKTLGAHGQLASDEHTRFRFRNRNVSGFLRADSALAVHQNPESRHNTVDEVPGYRKWGGFSVSAHKDGCFVYRAGGRTYRFDLSLFDLPETAQPATVAKARAPAKPQPARLKYTPDCVLKVVAGYMNQKYRPELPAPKIFFESTVPLRQFQDAAEPQWKVRPDVVSNIYAWRRNEVYLIDDAAYYAKYKRFIDDSLAHELAHYVQHKYQGADLEAIGADDEPEAIAAQNRFREEFMNNPGVCPAN